MVKNLNLDPGCRYMYSAYVINNRKLHPSWQMIPLQWCIISVLNPPLPRQIKSMQIDGSGQNLISLFNRWFSSPSLRSCVCTTCSWKTLERPIYPQCGLIIFTWWLPLYSLISILKFQQAQCHAMQHSLDFYASLAYLLLSFTVVVMSV